MHARVETHPINIISVVLTDSTAKAAIPNSPQIRAFSNIEAKGLKNAQNIFVLASASELPKLSNFVKRANEHKRLRALLVEQSEYPLWATQFLDRANLRSLRHLLVHSDNGMVRRILTAWSYGAQKQLIADAIVSEDKLFVLDCALDRYEIAFIDLKGLASIPSKQRRGFTISEEGAYMSWPDYDVDLNLESIKSVLNPTANDRVRQKHDSAYGAAIAKLRKARKIKQRDVTGLDERHLRRIEAGLQRPTSRSLQALAAAHKMKVNDYLNTVAQYIALNGRHK